MSLRWSVFGVESIYQFPSKIARTEIVCIPTLSSPKRTTSEPHRCDTVFDRSRPKRKPSFFCNIWVCVHGPSVASPNVEALHWKDITFLLS